MEIILRDPKLPIIKTLRLLIRDIEVKDVSDDYITWLNNPEITKFLEVRFSKHTRENVEDFVRSKLKTAESSKALIHAEHFGVYDNNGSRLVGTVTMPSIKSNHLSTDISFVIGHPDARGKGYGTEAVHAVVYYAFKHAGLKKLWGGYYDGHIASARVLAKNGFREEGRILKEFINVEGKRVDHVLVGLMAEDFVPNEKLLGPLPPKITKI
jgi:RimJ/RimL family protein N-acetyltransferase